MHRTPAARCCGDFVSGLSFAAGLAIVTFVPYKDAAAGPANFSRGCMVFVTRRLKLIAAILLSAAALGTAPAQAQEFPFGLEITLDASRMPGSKRIPSLDIGDNGEVVLELWCKGGKGQFSVAGNTIVFVPGAMENRSCPPERAQADDDLIAALGEAATWRRQGDFVTFVGAKTLRFRINTN